MSLGQEFLRAYQVLKRCDVAALLQPVEKRSSARRGPRNRVLGQKSREGDKSEGGVPRQSMAAGHAAVKGQDKDPKQRRSRDQEDEGPMQHHSRRRKRNTDDVDQDDLGDRP